jgi:hypothetical protein
LVLTRTTAARLSVACLPNAYPIPNGSGSISLTH